MCATWAPEQKPESSGTVMNADNSCHAIVPKNDNVHNSGLRAPNTLNEAAISLALQTMLSGTHHVNTLERCDKCWRRPVTQNSDGNARCVNHVHMPQNMAGHGYPTTPHKWLWLVPRCDKYLSAIKYVKPSARLLSIFTNIQSQGLNSSQLS